MMAVMMAPVVWPWVLAFHRFGGGADGRRARAVSTASFSSGYLTAWLFYAVGAALLQVLLLRAGAVDSLRGLAPAAGAGVLVIAGAFQFAPLKRACLMHCRNPLTYFLTRWRDGPAGAFRMGLGHGFFCVGCCWALMATALAVGVMNMWWMAALTAATFAEQVLPRGDRLRVPLGVALVAAGVLRAAG